MMQRQLKFFKESLLTITLALVLFFIMSAFIMIGKVDGSSMEPTYQDGDTVLIKKVLNNYSKDSIIVFTYKETQKNYYENISSSSWYNYSDTSNMLGEYHVKRIVGVPGDEIKISDNILYVNQIQISVYNQGDLVNQEYTLKDDEYFIQGDNIQNSFDSRQHGPITKEEMLGKVVF